MKKFIPLLVAAATVFVLSACSSFGTRKAGPTLQDVWRLDSVALLDTADTEAAMVVFLHAFSRKDSVPTFFAFTSDSLRIIEGSMVQRYRYTQEGARLLVQDSTLQEVAVTDLSDSTLVLNSGNKVRLHLRRVSSGPAQEESRPR
ncbi:hypothetical protein [Flaviaesturariibacter amylovorans]|uniref:Lipocalin-like domain-containing protein n=1 Tax=Flaviaesturariibacter amylovorans TaxID=1084520 RepID=A0ABP8GYE5_9BACT